MVLTTDRFEDLCHRAVWSLVPQLINDGTTLGVHSAALSERSRLMYLPRAKALGDGVGPFHGRGANHQSVLPSHLSLFRARPREMRLN